MNSLLTHQHHFILFQEYTYKYILFCFVEFFVLVGSRMGVNPRWCLKINHETAQMLKKGKGQSFYLWWYNRNRKADAAKRVKTELLFKRKEGCGEMEQLSRFTGRGQFVLGAFQPSLDFYSSVIPFSPAVMLSWQHLCLLL